MICCEIDWTRHEFSWYDAPRHAIRCESVPWDSLTYAVHAGYGGA